jgi:hypothetical protein
MIRLFQLQPEQSPYLAAVANRSKPHRCIQLYMQYARFFNLFKFQEFLINENRILYHYSNKIILLNDAVAK